MENEFEKDEQNVPDDIPEQDENVTETVADQPVTENEAPEEGAAEISSEGPAAEPEKETFAPPYFNNLNYTRREEPVPANEASDRPTPPPFGGYGQNAPTPGFDRPAPTEGQGYHNGAQGYAPGGAPQYGAHAPYGVPNVNGGGISYAPAKPEKQPKKKKSGGKGWVAIVVAVCVLLSFGAGFLGAYVAGVTGTVKTEPGTNEASNNSQPTVIHQVESTDVSDRKSSAGTSIYADVVSNVADSVVEVYTEYTMTGWFRYVVSGGGSGVIISEDGYIITNNHVVTANDDVTLADSVKVRMRDGEEYPATIIGGDKDADIAVIKIEAEGLTYATFGDSDAIAVGDEVIAIGNPLGRLGGTVTNGIISALAREISVEGNPMTLMQTNTAINPGNSGGGLFNLKGELIGIVNAVSDSSVEGISFAIPGNEALAKAKEIMDKGPASTGNTTGNTIIGVTLYNIDSSYKAAEFGVNALGVYIYEVKKGYNDDVLRVKDRVIAVDGVEISSGDNAIEEIRKHEPGEKLELTLFRDGEIIKIEVTCFESGGDA